MIFARLRQQLRSWVDNSTSTVGRKRYRAASRRKEFCYRQITLLNMHSYGRCCDIIRMTYFNQNLRLANTQDRLLTLNRINVQAHSSWLPPPKTSEFGIYATKSVLTHNWTPLQGLVRSNTRLLGTVCDDLNLPHLHPSLSFQIT